MEKKNAIKKQVLHIIKPRYVTKFNKEMVLYTLGIDLTDDFSNTTSQDIIIENAKVGMEFYYLNKKMVIISIDNNNILNTDGNSYEYEFITAAYKYELDSPRVSNNKVVVINEQIESLYKTIKMKDEEIQNLVKKDFTDKILIVLFLFAMLALTYYGL